MKYEKRYSFTRNNSFTRNTKHLHVVDAETNEIIAKVPLNGNREEAERRADTLALGPTAALTLDMLKQAEADNKRLREALEGLRDITADKMLDGAISGRTDHVGDAITAARAALEATDA